jgi:FixJ family two-component response regulator
METALIHVVEADPALRAEIEHLIQACGYQTKAYGSADEIIRKMPDRERAGCMVIDMQARDAAAPDLFDRLSKAGSNLPVIFLGGHSDVRAGVCVSAL